MRLSNKEKALLNKVKEGEVLLEDLDNIERGCLGKLMQNNLAEKQEEYEDKSYEGKSLSKVRIVLTSKGEDYET